MANPVLIDGARTPHGSYLGALAERGAVALGATAISGLVDRTRIDPEAVDWLVLGNSIPAGVGQVPARQAGLRAGLPDSLAATTVNEASGSGLRAIALAADRIDAGRARFAIAGGMESMSNAPYLVPASVRRGTRHGDLRVRDAMIYDALWDVGYDAHMGTLTEALVDRFDISRQAQDEYALESHRRAARSVDEGHFDDELVPVELDDGVLERDEGPRRETDLEQLGQLTPAFSADGTITAGNASDLNDGAGCVLVGSEAAAHDAGFEPMGEIVDYATAYRDPKWFSVAVGDVVERLLDANGLAVDDVDAFELNEAFAAQMVYVRDRLGIPDDAFNPRGGAIALGHPIGASGGILTTTLLYALRDFDGELGIVGMSVGGGGAIAMLVRRR